MAQIKKKFIDFGTGTDEVNSRDLPANFTPTNYTPVAVGSEGTDKVSSNLKGIDNALGSILIAESQVINLVSDLAGKLTTTLPSTEIFVGNASNIATAVAVTGDVTISNTGVTAIGTNKVTNTQLAQIATSTFKGRTTAGTGNVEDLSSTQATALLNNFVGDSGSGGTKGLVPAPAAGDAAASKFLKADGTWQTVSGVTGDISLTSWAGLADNTTDQVITGLVFSNAVVRSFDAIISFTVDATSDLFVQYKMQGIQRGSDWQITTDATGDAIPDVSFNITSLGQVRVSVGSISGFSTAEVQFRAQVTQV